MCWNIPRSPCGNDRRHLGLERIPYQCPTFLRTKAKKRVNPPHTGESKSCQYGDKAPLKPHMSWGGGVRVYFDWCISKCENRELLPAAPLQPCAEAPSWRGYLLLWTGLTWPDRTLFQHQCLPCSTGSGHPLAWWHVLTPLIQWVHLVIGFYPNLASTFPAQDCPPNVVIACHNIHRFYFFAMCIKVLLI